MSLETIIAENREHLLKLIQDNIKLSGNNCDLNHIDISRVTDLDSLFINSEFNGDISQWDTSNVVNMRGMFWNSNFNGNISKWNTSNVMNMHGTFSGSKFNGDISNWDTSNVQYMGRLFNNSDFNGDISNWDVANVVDMRNMFFSSKFIGDLSSWNFNLKCELDNIYHSSSLPTDGFLFWYFYLEGDIYEAAADKIEHFNEFKPLIDSFNIKGLQAAKYLHDSFRSKIASDNILNNIEFNHD